MKKRLMAIFAFLVILALAGCSSTRSFEITDAQTITLRSGSTGESVEITDAETIGQITDMINSIEFHKGKSSKQSSGWSYQIDWYDSSGDQIEGITIQGNDSIDYNDHFWSAPSSSIDTDFLADLLDG